MKSLKLQNVKQMNLGKQNKHLYILNKPNNLGDESFEFRLYRFGVWFLQLGCKNLFEEAQGIMDSERLLCQL